MITNKVIVCMFIALVCAIIGGFAVVGMVSKAVGFGSGAVGLIAAGGAIVLFRKGTRLCKNHEMKTCTKRNDTAQLHLKKLLNALPSSRR